MAAHEDSPSRGSDEGDLFDAEVRFGGPPLGAAGEEDARVEVGHGGAYPNASLAGAEHADDAGSESSSSDWPIDAKILAADNRPHDAPDEPSFPRHARRVRDRRLRPIHPSREPGACRLSAGTTGVVGPPSARSHGACGDPRAPPAYDKPAQVLLDVLQAPSPPSPSISPTNDVILLVTRTEYPPISRVAVPFLGLAGVRVEPRNHSKHDTRGGYGITPCATDYSLVRVADGAATHVTLPAGVCAGDPEWSADGKRYAFRNIAKDSVELWIGDAASADVHRVDGVRLNALFGYTLQWMPDQKTLLVKLVPDLGAPPAAPPVPLGPSIQETNGQKGQSSTYEARDTLKNKHDEDLFDYYAASQIALIDAASGKVTPIGKVANYAEVTPSPDGQHMLIETIHGPYSYLTAYNRFPYDVNVWDIAGNIIHVASLPLADRVPVHGVPTGPRDFSWRATEPATLFWAEALDGGDWNVSVPARDKIMMQKAPFQAPATEVTRATQRFAWFAWGEAPSLALLYENDENRHWRHVSTIDVDHPATKSALWDLSSDEHYQNPGEPVYRVLPNGSSVVRQEGSAIYLEGDGSSPDGDRPFSIAST